MTKEQELREALSAYVKAQGRMLDRWAEGDAAVKAELWKALHDCEESGRKALENPCCEETPCQWGDHPCERKRPMSTLRAAVAVTVPSKTPPGPPNKPMDFRSYEKSVTHTLQAASGTPRDGVTGRREGHECDGHKGNGVCPIHGHYGNR